MFGIRKLLMLSLLCVSLGLVTSTHDNFLWKLFTKGKSFIMSNLNSQRRRDGESFQYQEVNSVHNPANGYDEPEHREQTENKDPYEASYNKYGYSNTEVVHRGDNMELYSLLGGLSFASLLATTLVILSRRNGSLLRSTQDSYFRKHDQSESDDYEMIIKVPQIIYKISKVLSPFWAYRTRPEKHDGLLRSFQVVNLKYPYHTSTEDNNSRFFNITSN